MIRELIPWEWFTANEARNVVEYIMSIETTESQRRALLLEWAQEVGIEETWVEEVMEAWRQ